MPRVADPAARAASNPRPRQHLGPAAARGVRGLYRGLLRRRRLTVALLLGAATALALQAMAPHPATRPVLVAAADASTGDVLAVRRVEFPSRHLPDGALSPDALPAGSRARAAVRRGQVLTDATVSPSRAVPPGSVEVPVALPAAVAGWVDEGARILLYPTSGTEAFLTEQQDGPPSGTSPIGPVRVVATRPVEHTVADSGGAGGTVVLVAIDATDASRLADASASGSLWPALVP